MCVVTKDVKQNHMEILEEELQMMKLVVADYMEMVKYTFFNMLNYCLSCTKNNLLYFLAQQDRNN